MSHLSFILYVEIDVLCLFLLLYVLVQSAHIAESSYSSRCFLWSVCSMALFVLSDLLWALAEANALPVSADGAYLMNCFYFLCAHTAAISWFLYTESELDQSILSGKPLAVLTLVLTAAFCLLLLHNRQTGWLFQVNENCQFQRGPFYLLLFSILSFYLVFAVGHSLSRAWKKENYSHKKKYMNLASFALLPTMACTLEFIAPGSPLPCLGLSLGILSVHMNTQELLISVDPLTRLNNRYYMYQYLAMKMEHVSPDFELYLLIIDLDDFKQINDTHGHVEGDNALVRLSAILQKAADSFGCFASRYGGDEFILITEAGSEQEIKNLCLFIERELQENNKKTSAGYALQTSIGYARYQKSIRYIPDFIALADQALYQVKQARHPSA